MTKEIPQLNSGIRRASPEIAIALSGVLAIGGAGVTNAQENSSEPSPTPDILAELCDIKLPTESPMPSMAPEVQLSNGNTVIFESPSPEAEAVGVTAEDNLDSILEEKEIGTYDKLFNLINQDEHLDCDFKPVSKAIQKYYNENPDLKKIADEGSGGKNMFRTNLVFAESEMKKENADKRDLLFIGLGYAALQDTYIKTGDEGVYKFMQAYLGATADELGDDYKEFLNTILEGAKPLIEELEDSEEGLIQPEPTPEPTPELKDIKELLKAEGNPNTKQVSKAINKALKKNSDTEGIFPVKVIKSQWSDCIKGKGMDSRVENNRAAECSNLVYRLFEDYKLTGDEAYYVAAKSVYSWTMNALPGYLRGPVKDYLKN